MTNYYFLTAVLPPLALGKKTPLNFEELKDLFLMNLSKRDLDKVEKFRQYVDIKNLKAFLRSKPLDPKGHLSEKELDEAILLKADLPMYVFDFLQTYTENDARIHFFASLFSAFFDEMINNEKGFISSYFQFEKDCRLILSVLRAKKYNIDLSEQLQFEDPKDPVIAEILAGKDRPEYDPPQEYMPLKQIFQKFSDDPKKLTYNYLEFQFERVDQLVESEVFSIDKLLAYLIKWIMVDAWNQVENNKENLDILS